ncbi:MAG: alpha/beta hydrolase [Magnetococcales bacterium]|nr:alpha/beta hydrolase [Magnetococcales bacterium]
MTVRDLRFTSFDGVELEGTLEIPQGGVFDQLLVMVPGINVTRDEYLGFYTRLASQLRENSIASFRFDWRCHGFDSSRPLSELTLAGLYNDIDAAVRIASESINKISKISVLAQSFSGGVASTWCSRNESMIDKCVLFAPILDYIHEYIKGSDEGGRAGESKGNYDGLSDNAIVELTQKNTLVSWGKPFGRPIINEFKAFETLLPTKNIWIFHGDKDAGVDITISRNRVKGDHNEAKLIEIPGADHGFAQPGDANFKEEKTKFFQASVFEELIGLLNHGSLSGKFPVIG